MNTANSVAELAIAIPSSIAVMERLQIDYCCHGQQTVDQACSSAGITSDELLRLIQASPSLETDAPPPEAALAEMIRFIVATHHVFTRSTLETLQTLARKVCEHHGPNHQELVMVERLVSELSAELIPHMLKEEQVLFPYVTALEGALGRGEEAPLPFFGTVRNPIRMMMLEHEAAGEKMTEIRAVTEDYTVPADGCPSYHALYQTLGDLEQDLHRHIHFENNVLFPRAAAMEGERHAASAGAFGDGCCHH